MADDGSGQSVTAEDRAPALENAGNTGSHEGEELVSPRSATALLQSMSQIASQTAISVRETVVSAKESVAAVRQTMVMAKDSVLNPPQENESLANGSSVYEEGAEKSILVHSLVHD